VDDSVLAGLGISHRISCSLNVTVLVKSHADRRNKELSIFGLHLDVAPIELRQSLNVLHAYSLETLTFGLRCPLHLRRGEDLARVAAQKHLAASNP
jgi:hypothetical protein